MPVNNFSGQLPQDDGRIERSTAAASFDARLSSSLTLTADLIYNRRRIENPPAPYLNNYLSPGGELPHPIDGDLNLGARGIFKGQRNQITNVGLAWQFAPDWKANVDYSETMNRTRCNKILLDLTSSSGEFDSYVYDQAFNVNVKTVQAMLRGRLAVGRMTHKIVAGAARQFLPQRRDGRVRLHRQQQPACAGRAVVRVADAPDMEKSDYTNQDVLFISDGITFGPRWSMLAGVRHTRYETAGVWGDWDEYSKSVSSPTFALFFKPDAGATLYASYIESLQEGAMVEAQYENHDQKLPPLKSKQYELGAKLDRGWWSAAVPRCSASSAAPSTAMRPTTMCRTAWNAIRG